MKTGVVYKKGGYQVVKAPDSVVKTPKSVVKPTAPKSVEYSPTGTPSTRTTLLPQIKAFDARQALDKKIDLKTNTPKEQFHMDRMAKKTDKELAKARKTTGEESVQHFVKAKGFAKAGLGPASKESKALYYTERATGKVPEYGARAAKGLGVKGFLVIGIGVGGFVLYSRLKKTISDWTPGAIIEAVAEDPINFLIAALIIGVIVWFLFFRKKGGE